MGDAIRPAGGLARARGEHGCFSCFCWRGDELNSTPESDRDDMGDEKGLLVLLDPK
jgi:hypothetical protein